MQKIAVIPGDGIGKEVINSSIRVLKSLDLQLKFEFAQAGWEVFTKTGRSVPPQTLELMKNSDATLAGAFSSPKKKVDGFFSAIRYMRQELELYANLRPAKSRPISASKKNIDMLMVRENSEGIYVAQERRYGDLAIADAVVTKKASNRIAHLALDLAKTRRNKLAVIHKANVLPLTSGLFLETARDAAKDYPKVDTQDVIVDAAAMLLVRQPEDFDVLVTTNLFGDILSDLMAALVGGLGLVPSANIGDRYSIFEPVHGSAPDIAGKGIANPTAAILSASLMLEHLGEIEAAKRLDKAINDVFEIAVLTPDLGGTATSDEFTNEVIKALSK